MIFRSAKVPFNKCAVEFVVINDGSLGFLALLYILE